MSKKFKLGPMQKKWIRELKSKKYKQCKGELCSAKTGGYCCLGVANDCLSLGEDVINYKKSSEIIVKSILP